MWCHGFLGMGSERLFRLGRKISLGFVVAMGIKWVDFSL